MDKTMVCLTTFDNPYDPFDQFDQWFVYDVTNGYDCCGLIARIVKLSDEMTEKEINLAIESAIDKIVEEDFTYQYKKVKRE